MTAVAIAPYSGWPMIHIANMKAATPVRPAAMLLPVWRNTRCAVEAAVSRQTIGRMR